MRMEDTGLSLLVQQREIQNRCYHPLGGFEPFKREDIEQSISARFEKQVQKYPDRLAIKVDDQEMTYAQLNQAANHIARIVAEKYGSKDSPIVLLLEHGISMVCGIIGVLKAGKTYVPLDPLFPQARNAHIMSDSLAGMLVTNTSNFEYATELNEQKLPLINIDEFDADQPAENLDLELSPDQTAYILYTSGSTGLPKGVYQSHRNLLHNIMQYTNTLHICHNDRMTLLYSFNVNGSLRGMYGALLNGATLFPYDVKAKGLTDVADWLNREEITFFHSVPTVFRHFIDTLHGDEQFPHVRLIRFGGERVPVDNVDFYKKHFPPHCILYTGMGSTETCTVRQYFTDKNTELTESVVPTGFAVEEREVILLDEHGRVVPVNEVGQIAVKSRYLALGYWGKPEETAKKFIPAPDDDQARIYLTGDLGRILPDGRLIHMGRSDTQVKVRGHRVETAEIEAVLLKHSGIKEAAVLAWPDGHGDNFLVAYTVFHKGDSLKASELRQHLHESLPDYMIPASFVVLAAMPLTPNSKINKRALPRPEKVRPDLETEFVAPETSVEKSLAEIWDAVLGINEIGIHDNFFELGGHSLAATRVMSRIRDAFEVDLPLRAIFETPTISTIAGLISQNQTNILQINSIERVSRERKGLPLSFAQQRLWFLDKLEPGSSAYHIVTAHQLVGNLNMTALEQSINEIVRRHEALRTTIATDGDQPVQIVAPEMKIALNVKDISSMPASQQEAETQRLIKEIQLQPFDLSVGPLVRIALLQLNSTVHILVFVMHHIISDAWSMNILFAELSRCYDAFSEGKNPSLPELPIQYGDFADWQRNWLQGEVLDEQIAYWKQHLGGSPSVLTLPEDFPRPPVQTFRGGQHSVILPFETSRALQALSRQENVTLFAVLLSAFKVLLYRHTRQDGVVLGIPIASRNRQEIENLIGFFISTLVLYTPVSPDSTFKELLAQEREILLGAYEHQELPFEKLVEELRPERDLSHTPLFQIFFNMTTEELHRLTLKGLHVELTVPAERESKFDMTLYVNETDGDIRLKLVYNADLFLKDRMVDLLEQFEVLLQQVVDAPNRPIQSYSLLTPTSQTVLPDPVMELDEPRQKLIMDMFDSWVQQSPSSPAIRHGNHVVSYAELSEMARSIAHILQFNGLKRGHVAAIYGQRSLGVIASMLGVLMSGGILLSIDPTLPDKRKQVMYQEANAKALVYVGESHDDKISWLDKDSLTNLISVGAVTGKLLKIDSGSKIGAISWSDCKGDDPAYVFFTSGTTGVPKGVLGCHKGLSHFLTWQRETFSVGPGDRSAQLTGLSFDVVMRDIFMPLTSGATLCIPDNVDNLGVDQTIQWLKRQRITILHTVPTIAQTWLSVMAKNVTLPDLKLIFFAGEPLTDTLINNWRLHFPKGRIVNLYGPTETTLAKCYYEVPVEPRPGIQPVGRSLPQTQVLVLSSDKKQCGIGEMGEIVIRTPFRSLGYINAPEEMQKKFVPTSFRSDASDLLYFTGDRGRYRPDGLIEILGRVDDQVKIRGVRIEPGEITASLARHPAVNACVVIARRDDQPDTYLAAYVIPKDYSLTISDLREYLEQRLVAAMVPRAFVFLEELPRTPNGKIDRRVLPAPQWDDLVAGNFVAPRDELELKLVKLWEQLLNTRPIGIQDNFFDVGGHSLLAVQLFAQIKKIVGQDLPLATLFQAPTIEKIANLLRDDGWNPTWSSLVPMQPEGSNPPLFCVHAVGGNVLSLRDLASHLGTDQPFYALQSQGLDGKQTPPSRVEEMARYYLEELQTVQPTGPYYLAGQSSGGVIAFEMAQQLQAQGHSVAFLALIDTYEPRRKESLSITKSDRYKYHLKNLGKYGFPYLKNQVQARLEKSWRKLTRVISKQVSIVYQLLGQPVPYSFRHSLVSRTVQHATRNYTPCVYPGRIILFRATNTVRAYVEDRYGVQRGWKEYAAGGLEIYNINGAHNLEQEPFVGILAEHLKRDLKKAQESIEM